MQISDFGIRNIDLMPDKGRTIILYGKAGIGKTTLLNTLFGKILLINIDCGEQVLDPKNNNNEFSICTLVSRKLQNPIESVNKLEAFIDFLMTQEVLEWDYIVVDNISELEDIYADALRKKRNQVYSEDFLNIDVGVDILRILKKMRNLTYLGPDVLYLAWEKTVKITDSDGEIHSEKGPMIMGSTQLKIEGLSDFVMAMRVDKKGGRYLQLDADNKYAAKKRTEPGREYPSIIQCPLEDKNILQCFFDLIHGRN